MTWLAEICVCLHLSLGAMLCERPGVFTDPHAVWFWGGVWTVWPAFKHSGNTHVCEYCWVMWLILALGGPVAVRRSRMWGSQCIDWAIGRSAVEPGPRWGRSLVGLGRAGFWASTLIFFSFNISLAMQMIFAKADWAHPPCFPVFAISEPFRSFFSTWHLRGWSLMMGASCPGARTAMGQTRTCGRVP